MRRTLRLLPLVLSLLLSACVPTLLVGNQLQSRLMWAFIEPLVGFNPNEINFFEAPLVKDRMTALLGERYEPAMQLLRTANEIQQEGVLYYVVSRHAPEEARAVADTAGLVWNADTNQMAVLLVQDGVPALLAEQAEGAATRLIEPVLPAELKTAYDTARAVEATLDEATDAPLDGVLQESEDPLLDLIRQRNL